MRKFKVFGLAAALTACVGMIGAGVIANASDAAEEQEITAEAEENSLEEAIEDLGGEAVFEEAATIPEVVKATMPAMVAITNTSVQEVRNYFNGDPFEYFFGDYFGGFGGYGGRNGRNYGYDSEPQTRESVSMGSGVIVGQTDDEILIATNEHVVNGATELSVAFVDDTAAEAEIVGTDASHDLAVIRVAIDDIEDETLDKIDVIAFGSSGDLEVGEQVIAIGNALGYGQSVSSGIVSALNRTITSQNETTGSVEKTEGMIQTDASINPGNSGGALLNMKGELIGINSAKYADTMVEGMGYAIPSDIALPILTDLANGKTAGGSYTNEDGSVKLGVTVATITEEYQASYLIPNGVYVVDVEAGGAASNAGIKSGDIITAIDGKAINSVEELKAALGNYKPGDFATLTISRPGSGSFGDNSYETGSVTVTFGSVEAKMAA